MGLNVSSMSESLAITLVHGWKILQLPITLVHEWKILETFFFFIA